MALKTCRECGHKVSSEAKVCPNCGVKEPYQSPVRGLIFIAIVIIAIYKGCSDDGSSASNSYHSNDVASSNAPTSQPFISPDVAKLKGHLLSICHQPVPRHSQQSRCVKPRLRECLGEILAV